MAYSVPFIHEGIDQGFQDRNDPILYRIRVPTRGDGDTGSPQGPEVRYLTAPSPPTGISSVITYRGQLLAFDTVPAGDWNLGRLRVVVPEGSTEGRYVLASTEKADLGETVGILDAGPAWVDKRLTSWT